MFRDTYQNIRFKILNIFRFLPGLKRFALRRLPGYRKGYKHYWVDGNNVNYRLSMYNRQKKDGVMPLVDNPSMSEIIKMIDLCKPKSVLEIGCGYGRLLDDLKSYFNITGADISKDMLKLCPSDVLVFELDIVCPDAEWLKDLNNRWDVVFSRAVMQYFFKHPEDMKKVLMNLEILANKKVIFWEWPHVCDYMKNIYQSDKFEFRPIKIKVE